MKKKSFILLGLAIMVVCASLTFVHKTESLNSFIAENAEALSSGEESPQGRFKTVACDSDNFSDWKTYCCPSDYYNTCEGRVGTCPHPPVNGCQDTFWE